MPTTSEARRRRKRGPLLTWRRNMTATPRATDPKLVVNPRIPNAPTPLGTLSILPREVRDEVYRLLCKPTYSQKLHLSKNGAFHAMFLDSTELAVIELSKTIRQEYLAILYREAIFFFCDSGCDYWNKWSCGDVRIINQIHRVEYSTPLGICRRADGETEATKFPQKFAEPISYFGGTELLKTSCSIKLKCLRPSVILILESLFFEAVRNLKGFRSVTVELNFETKPWKLEQARRYLGGVVSGNFALASEDAVEKWRDALEPSLGPGVISRTPHATDRISFIWTIMFRPHDYISKRRAQGLIQAPGKLLEMKHHQRSKAPEDTVIKKRQKIARTHNFLTYHDEHDR